MLSARWLYLFGMAVTTAAQAKDLHGILVDSGGKPAANAKLSLGLLGPRSATSPTTANTDGAGSFTIAGLDDTIALPLTDDADRPLPGVILRIAGLMVPRDEARQSWANVAPVTDPAWQGFSVAKSAPDGAVAFAGLPVGASLLVMVQSPTYSFDHPPTDIA